MILRLLSQALSQGPICVGQVSVHPDFVLHHHEDKRDGCLETFFTPEAAERLARWDASGRFRPLKTAPNLRRGWKLVLESLSQTRVALEYFYPAALGHAAAVARGTLQPIALRDYLARQTGMYAVTKKATDTEVEECIREVCVVGCLNRILWPIAPGQPPRSAAQPLSNTPHPFPLLCTAACPLLVGAIRTRVKQRLALASAAPSDADGTELGESGGGGSED